MPTTQTEQELYKQYDAFLDECFASVRVANWRYYPSDVLKSCDPIAYRIGFSEWLDSIERDSIEQE